MEQARLRMLEKWAEPPWGDQRDLLQDMAEAARGSAPADRPLVGGIGTNAGTLGPLANGSAQTHPSPGNLSKYPINAERFCQKVPPGIHSRA